MKIDHVIKEYVNIHNRIFECLEPAADAGKKFSQRLSQLEKKTLLFI